MLAVAVVAAHTASAPVLFYMVGAADAVQAFFIISGFLISYVLNEKYRNFGDFYRSRAARIYPPYFVWLATTVLILMLLGQAPRIWNEWNNLSFGATAYFLLSNLFIVGQDASFYFTLDPAGHLFAIKNFHDHENQIWTFFLIPQAWSLSLEVVFYALAPFIVRRFSRVVAVLICAMVIKWGVFTYWDARDPYFYRAFPIEIGSFMMGSVAYYIWRALKPVTVIPAIGWCAAATLWMTLIFLRFIPAGQPMTILFTNQQIILRLAFIGLLPIVFKAASSNPVDRFLGELSYPVYLCHLTVIVACGGLFKLNSASGPIFFFVTLALSLVLASATYLLLDKPREKRRSVRSAAAAHSGLRQPAASESVLNVPAGGFGLVAEPVD